MKQSHAASAARDSADAYCADLVREADKDRFLGALFAPDARRPQLLALYALNVELARVREQARDPRLGEIRLQWWREAVEGIYAGRSAEHPVVQALARAIEAGELPVRGFLRMTEARRFDLYDEPMPSLNDLEGYLGDTAAALIQLGSLVLAGEGAHSAAEAAGFAGVAYGMTGLLRLLPVHRARGQCFVPLDLLGKYQLTAADALHAPAGTALRLALADLRRCAETRLGEARQRLASVPKPALPAFLPVSLVDLYLRRMAGSNFDLLTTVAELPQLRRQWRLWRFALKEAF